MNRKELTGSQIIDGKSSQSEANNEPEYQVEQEQYELEDPVLG